MKKISKIFYLGLMILVVPGFAVVGQSRSEGKVKTGTFNPKDVVNISTASGEIVVRAENVSEIAVEVVYTHSQESYDPQFIEKNGELLLREEFHGSSRRGRATWTVTVPKNTRIDGNSASGEITVQGLEAKCTLSTASGEIGVSRSSGNLRINTASGRVEVKDHRGDISLGSASGNLTLKGIDGNVKANSASGRITIENVEGLLDLNTASGKIRGDSIAIGHHSNVSSASGSVSISLSQSLEYDVTINTASGNATLDYAGNRVAGQFVFEARQDRGRIISPFDFDTETTFVRNGHTYDRKSFVRGSETPKIRLSTASGTMRLRR